MKRNLSLTLLACLFIAHTGHTQTTEGIAQKGFKYNNHFNLALGIGGDGFTSALSWVKFYDVGKKKKFKIGYGLRLSNYFGTNNTYKTAPAHLIKQEKIDEITFSQSQTNSLNATLNFAYGISPKFEIGFNIDAIGISFGAEQNASKAGIHMGKANPTTGNFLLVGNNDIGNLNSEFYIRYRVRSTFSIRAGLSHFFSEYTTQTKLAYNNNRYRLITDLGFIGFTFSPFLKN